MAHWQLPPVIWTKPPRCNRSAAAWRAAGVSPLLDRAYSGHMPAARPSGGVMVAAGDPGDPIVPNALPWPARRKSRLLLYKRFRPIRMENSRGGYLADLRVPCLRPCGCRGGGRSMAVFRRCAREV